MALKTRFTELVGVEHPIVQGGMQWVGRAELVAEYRSEFASPYLAASRGYITDIIEPATTRSVISLSLRKLLGKRETRPPKKHGLIPL